MIGAIVGFVIRKSDHHAFDVLRILTVAEGDLTTLRQVVGSIRLISFGTLLLCWGYLGYLLGFWALNWLTVEPYAPAARLVEGIVSALLLGLLSVLVGLKALPDTAHTVEEPSLRWWHLLRSHRRCCNDLLASPADSRLTAVTTVS